MPLNNSGYTCFVIWSAVSCVMPRIGYTHMLAWYLSMTWDFNKYSISVIRSKRILCSLMAVRDLWQIYDVTHIFVLPLCSWLFIDMNIEIIPEEFILCWNNALQKHGDLTKADCLKHIPIFLEGLLLRPCNAQRILYYNIYL